MSITTARYGYRDRQTSLKSPKTGLCKRSRQLSGERALTSANTNVPPAGNMLVENEGATTRRVT